MTYDPDMELLRAWQSGDERAGHRLFKRHIKSMQKFFGNKVMAPADADDLIQETFLGCVRNAASFRGDATFRTFLFHVARKRLADYVRARAKRPRAIDLDEISVADIAPGPSTIQASNRQQAIVLDALRAIPLTDQIILELHYWEELSGPEIGIILELTLPAVRSRLRRAIKRLEKQIARLARTPEERTGTIEGLARWAAEIRDQMKQSAPDPEPSLL